MKHTRLEDGTSSTASDAEWLPWGGDGAPPAPRCSDPATATCLVLVEASAGYVGDPHEHTSAEMSYVLSGTVEHQGVAMGGGDGYVAGAGSKHTGFTVTTDATYVLAFKL